MLHYAAGQAFRAGWRARGCMQAAAGTQLPLVSQKVGENVTCRYCTDASCLLCQLGTSAAHISETGGISSPAGQLERMAEQRAMISAPALTLDEVTALVSSSVACPLCKKVYRDMFLHYQQEHPEVRGLPPGPGEP